MKYIYYIAAVLVLAVVLIIVQFVQGKPAVEKKPAIIVNEKVISMAEFDKIRPVHDVTASEFINSLVTKELLIQEAQREGIDKEETFRRSIQNFYEQSLVKVLMDRKFASLKVTVSDEEVERYKTFLGKTISLTIYTAASAEDINAGRGREEKRDVRFSDLSSKMQGLAVILKQGARSVPVQSGSEYVSLRLDGVKSGGGSRAAVNNEVIRKLIADEKKEEMISEWLEGLRSRAKIKILVSGTNGGR